MLEQPGKRQPSFKGVPCIWSRPSRKRKVENIPIQEVKFVKHEHGKSKVFQKGTDPASKDVRPVYKRNSNATDL